MISRSKWRIRPEEDDNEALSDIDLISPARFITSSFSLRSPHCWHMNPLSSSTSRKEISYSYSNLVNQKLIHAINRRWYTRVTKQETFTPTIFTTIAFQNRTFLDIINLSLHKITSQVQSNTKPREHYYKNRKHKEIKIRKGTNFMQRGQVQEKKYCSLRAFCRVIVLPAVSM